MASDRSKLVIAFLICSANSTDFVGLQLFCDGFVLSAMFYAIGSGGAIGGTVGAVGAVSGSGGRSVFRLYPTQFPRHPTQFPPQFRRYKR